MLLNGFSVRVEGGKERSGYVELAHRQKYALILGNQRAEACDAKVTIDGQVVGTWRINSYGSIRIERPAEDDGRFTFYAHGTSEAAEAGINSEDYLSGVISVEFVPSVRYIRGFTDPRPPVIHRWNDYDYWWERPTVFYTSSTGNTGPQGTVGDVGCYGFSSHAVGGGTGLSGQSYQEFYNAPELQLDYSQSTTINIRLVLRQWNSDRPRPLSMHSNPVPPPVR